MKSRPSFLTIFTSVALLAGFIATAPQASAQTTVTTDPVGFITLTFAGTGGTATQAITFSGLGMANPVSYQGNVDAVASVSGHAVLTSTSAGFTDNQYNFPNGSYFVEITSGSNAGVTSDIIATTASNNSITTFDNISSLVTAGNSMRIRAHWTIGSVFGATNQAGLTAGNSSTADQILVYNGSGYDIYFYSSGGIIGAGWRKTGGGNADQSTAKIEPDQGLIIKRTSGSSTASINLVLQGAVKTGQSYVPVQQGANILGNVYGANMTLGDSGLYTGSSSTGVLAGNSSTADQILIWNGSGYDIYFYSSGGIIGSGWRKTGGGNSDQSTAIISAGSAIVLQRQSSAPAFNWVVPQHPTSFN